MGRFALLLTLHGVSKMEYGIHQVVKTLKSDPFYTPLEKEKMDMIDLKKYGITNVKEIVYNPSYEELFEAEMDPSLEGFEKGQLTE